MIDPNTGLPFKIPTGKDHEKKWDNISQLERLDYLLDAFYDSIDEDHPDNKIVAICISQQRWEVIPYAIQLAIEGNSQFGNDVFDEVNE